MRIGFDIRTIGKNRTGDETVTLQLVDNLLSVGKRNRFFLFTDEKLPVLISEIEKRFNKKKKETANFKICSVTPSRKAFWTFWSLPKFVKKNPIDVLHVQYITPLWLPKKIKLVTTVHDISFARYPAFIAKKDLMLLKIFIPLSLKKADKIIAVSEFTKREIIKVYNIDENKIEVVYNGGATKEFFTEASDDAIFKFKEEKKLPEEFILYVGTLQPRKNIPFLLQTFVELKQKLAAKDEISNLSLIIGGKRFGHNYDSDIDTKLKEIKRNFPDIANQIKFVGFIADDDLPMYYKSAKLLVITSSYEGFGLPAIEAMASKTPVLTTDTSCMKEICADAAMIYRHNDPEDFISKLQEVVCDKTRRNKIVEKGMKRAREFDWNLAAKQTMNIYRKLK